MPITHFISERIIIYFIGDNGKQFTSHKMHNFTQQNKITQRFASVRHAKCNIVERANKTIIQCLRLYVHNKHSKWVKYINFIQDAINNSISSATGYTPNEAHFGIKPTYFWEKNFKDIVIQKKVEYQVVLAQIKENIIKQGTRNRKAHDSKIKIFHRFKIGDMVWVRNYQLSNKLNKEISKFFQLWNGPFKIMEEYGKTTYLLGDANGETLGKFHISQLKPYYALEATQDLNL